MKKLDEYTPCELASLALALAVIIASKLNIDQQNVVGNFILGVGQTILILAAQGQYIQTQEQNQCGDSGNNNSDSNKNLQKQIDELKEYIKKFDNNMNC